MRPSSSPRSNAATGDKSAATRAPRKTMFKRKKSNPFAGPNAPVIDWKDVDLLKRFVTDTFRVLPTRISFVPQIQQRKLSSAIRRARFMALMPYTG